MTMKNINNNPNLIKLWTDNEKMAEKQYYKENSDSLIPLFEQELRNLGFEFETSNQVFDLSGKHAKAIVPIAIKYYQLAKELDKPNEQNHFMSFFYIKGLDDVIPTLIEDYYSEKTTDLTRWFISDCIYQIRSRHFVKEYLEIAINKTFGQNRQMIVLLLGKLKEEGAISTLISLLEDEDVRLHAICALGEFKREEFRCHFEKFQNSTHPGWRKYAKAALKKLNNLK